MTAVKLSDEDKELIRSYVADVDDEEVKKQRRKECAEQYNVSLATISAITAWTKIRANRTTLESRPVEIVVKEDNAEGSHANYDNPTKQLWRETWKKFLAARTLPHEREKMKVLCLPGKKCLEIPLYLDLGFNPKNITGVEGGDEAAKMEFHQNAYRYGIVTKLGRLENLLAHDNNVYDVVSLDFTGPLSKTCLDIIRNLPIAPAANNQFNTKSYFMVNLLAKREQIKGQLCLDFYASFTRPELMEMFKAPGMDIERFNTVFGYMTELADKASSGERAYEEADLKDKRNMGLIFMITSLIAKNRRFQDSVWSSYRLNDVPLHVRQEIDFNGYAAKTMNVFLGGLAFYVQKKLLDTLMIAAPQIVETVSNYRPFLYGVEQYQYTSPVNNSNSPFITEMYEFMTPMADYIKLRYFVRFFVDAIFWQGLNAGRPIYLDVRDKHGHVRKPGYDLHYKDSIGFVAEDGQVISTITFQRIMDAITAFIDHINKDQSMNILSKGQNSRINLSD